MPIDCGTIELLELLWCDFKGSWVKEYDGDIILSDERFFLFKHQRLFYDIIIYIDIYLVDLEPIIFRE